MMTPSADHVAVHNPLRLWPGVVIVCLQWLIMVGLPIVAPEQGGLAIIAGVAGALFIIVWWLFFSRALWVERVAAILVMIAGVAITSRIVHQSISNGMMGFMLYLYAPPVLSLALVAWAAASRRLTTGWRRVTMAAALLLACASLTLIRTNGMTGNATADFEWRWTPTAEEQLLAHDTSRDVAPAAPTAPTLIPLSPATIPPPPARPAATPTVDNIEPGTATSEQKSPQRQWPGFRGESRDSVVRGVVIERDWSRTPPIQLWRQPVGPAWSSFAVAGDLIFTQEQRGDDEIVSAYSLKTGAPVWKHRDAARFWESNAGAGPRATPTFRDGRLYTLGGTGILNALNARDGSAIWMRNAASDTGRKVPDWGIASSPLVVGNTVIAATAGWLVAYDLATGKPLWAGPKEGYGYSSPQLVTFDGVAQIVLVNGPGVISVAPSDGKVLWKHSWGGDSIVQPAVLADGDLLIGSGSGLAAQTGLLRLSVSHDEGGWTTKERWTSTGLKPYFNDFVVHHGHAFGFDGGILACVDLADGTRKWKGGRYGHGQLILLSDQNLLLVLSEDGELALVSATADQFTEVARVPGIEGKTWNHPVLVGDVLLVRNGQEMAAFRLTVAGR